MRLLLVEVQRLGWRRAVRLLAVVSLVVPILILAGIAWGTRPVSDAEMEQAQRMAAEQQVYADQERERCLESPEEYGAEEPVDDLEKYCTDMTGGEQKAEWFLSRSPLDVAAQLEESGPGVAIVLVALAMLIGTTFVGADWASGSMSNQLLFEPRRLRVWAAKAAALAVGAFVVAAVATTVFWGLFAGLAASRDIPISGTLWESIAWLGFRGSLLASAAALAGFALTMLLRNTVGTLGLMFAAAVGGSLLIIALPFEGTGRWLLSNNVLGVLMDGYGYYDESLVNCSEADYMAGKECTAEAFMTMGEGLSFLGALLLGALALSIPSFLRRDVP